MRERRSVVLLVLILVSHVASIALRGSGHNPRRDVIKELEHSKNKHEFMNTVFSRPKSHAGVWNRHGITRQKNEAGLGIHVDTAQEKADKEDVMGVNWAEEGRPNPNEWEAQHQLDLNHHQIDISRLEFKDIYRTDLDEGKTEPEYKYKGPEVQPLDNQESLNPSGPVYHPGVQPNIPRPGDMVSTGADFEVEPPEPMAPMPPYLYPEATDGEFQANVPPMYRAFYPSTAPIAHPADGGKGDDCIKVADLPYIRNLMPGKVSDDYCVPAKFLPYYHPQESPQLAQTPDADTTSGLSENGYPSQTMQPMISSPQFDLPMPFAHGPMFPAFHPPGPGEHSINPPPMVPLPAPANYNGNARRMPAMPMPPLPPAMWPYG